jgi:hypothetical protein
VKIHIAVKVYSGIGLLVFVVVKSMVNTVPPVGGCSGYSQLTGKFAVNRRHALTTYYPPD